MDSKHPQKASSAMGIDLKTKGVAVDSLVDEFIMVAAWRLSTDERKNLVGKSTNPPRSLPFSLEL